MTSQRAPFVLVESNTTGTGELFIHRIAARGLTPVLLSRDPDRYDFVRGGARPLPPGTVVRRLDTTDRELLLDTCHHDYPDIVGLFTSSDYAIPTAAWLASRLGLPGGDPEAIRDCRCKAWQRTRVGRITPWLNPLWRAVTGPEEIAAAVAYVGTPVVVKPCSASGSVGVRLCADGDEAYRHATALLARSAGCGHVLIEAYVVGGEYSVEVFDTTVVGVTEKRTGNGPSFIEVSHTYPAAYDAAVQVAGPARQVADILGLGWGPSHIEFRIGAYGPVLMEANPRLAGGWIPVLIDLAQGIDLVATTISRALGEPFTLLPARGRVSGVRFVIRRPGRAVAPADVSRIRHADPRIVDVGTYPNALGKSGATGDNTDRLAFAVAVDDDRDDLNAVLDRAERLLATALHPVGAV